MLLSGLSLRRLYKQAFPGWALGEARTTPCLRLQPMAQAWRHSCIQAVLFLLRLLWAGGHGLGTPHLTPSEGTWKPPN